MRSLIFAAFAPLAMALTAVPASAQIVGRHDYGPVGQGNPFIGDSSFGWPGVRRDMRDIRDRISDGRESGQLSQGEARQLRRDARRLAIVSRAYRRDGLSASEAHALHAWALALQSRVNAARLVDRPRTRTSRR
ncbi:MAG: hypothetical protein QOI38_1351 [Sphingomonadales bacterium]|jgi:hypothetical protein|nr:hypothetical protein [Sphingomonadales bacterium]